MSLHTTLSFVWPPTTSTMAIQDVDEIRRGSVAKLIVKFETLGRGEVVTTSAPTKHPGPRLGGCDGTTLPVNGFGDVDVDGSSCPGTQTPRQELRPSHNGVDHDGDGSGDGVRPRPDRSSHAPVLDDEPTGVLLVTVHTDGVTFGPVKRRGTYDDGIRRLPDNATRGSVVDEGPAGDLLVKIYTNGVGCGQEKRRDTGVDKVRRRPSGGARRKSHKPVVSVEPAQDFTVIIICLFILLIVNMYVYMYMYVLMYICYMMFLYIDIN